MTSASGVRVEGPVEGRAGEVLTPEALDFVADLHRALSARRRDLLAAREERRARFAAGELPAFEAETANVREGDWRVPPAPADLADRRVEITGPTERKMVINALNSGARVFMADFEDSNAPTWSNMVEGQVNLIDAVRGTIEFAQPDGRTYRLGDDPAVLVVRPRGWHLDERHVTVDGEPVSASLFDFGLYLFHNAAALAERGSGPYYYLPKLEHYLEARLWADAFTRAEDALGLARGTVRATVLIETITAAFQVEEILYELREHITGLNAGRWDYIFSVIKNFGANERFVLPDRQHVTMTVPFMRAYTELLVRTCHRRGAHAIGGMAAFIPSRRDPEVNRIAIDRVREDKQREAGDGFDGTWVAHPDLVPVALEVFDGVLGDRPNQLDRQRDDVDVRPEDLVHVSFPDESGVTEEGLRNNVRVALQYIAAWLAGTGAVAINNLMEDLATAEISRSQLWQWRRLGTRLPNGEHVTDDLVRTVIAEELGKLRADAAEVRESSSEAPELPYQPAAEILRRVSLGEEFVDFIPTVAYERLA